MSTNKRPKLETILDIKYNLRYFLSYLISPEEEITQEQQKEFLNFFESKKINKYKVATDLEYLSKAFGNVLESTESDSGTS